MTHGYVHLGWINGFQEVEWRNNPLANCHNMDALWGFMIRVGEQCCMLVSADLRDPILWWLLKVGTRQKWLLTPLTDDSYRWGLSGPTSTSQSADNDEGLQGTGWGDGGPVYLGT